MLYEHHKNIILYTGMMPVSYDTIYYVVFCTES